MSERTGFETARPVWQGRTDALGLLRALLAVSVLVPTLVFALAAWQNWQHLEQAAEDRARKTAAIIAEHTLKVFDSHEQVLDRVDERLRGMSWDAIRQSRDVHEQLRRLADTLDHVEGIGLLDPEGRLAALGRVFPVPRLDLSDREYYRVLKAADPGTFVSEPTDSRLSGPLVFRVARRRSSPDGSFDGVVFASILPDYFHRFYRSVTAGEDAVTMARADGTVLVRDPPVTTGVQVLSPQSGLMQGIAQAEQGTYRTVSELDRVERVHAYRRIGRHPVYVSYGLSLAAVAREWRANLLTFGTVAVLASLALLSVSVLALRRARQERRMFMRWQEEARRRESAEEALHQAQKMEAVGQLTGGVAHDFNNMLTVIVSSLDMIERAAADPPRIRRLAGLAMNAAERGARLTQQLLAFARRQALKPETVHVNRLVREFEPLLQRAVGEAVAVDVRLDPALGPCEIDPAQFQAAILNLAVNARDAMPDGGRLTIETAAVTLDAAAAAAIPEAAPGSYARITVSDTGAGIPPEILPRVFEPFFTTKEVGKGTGLGLSQVYGFVRQSGGFARIDSRLGRGTAVQIYLPHASDAAREETEDAATPRATLRGETILVVEDDDTARTVV
ncbi:MAG: ATP-binding protein, partial [Pseudomonadota bacterium]|nr:ATP-binding protein [Pseudomonadota bacterium]